jgi:Uma2 family endonuclease
VSPYCTVDTDNGALRCAPALHVEPRIVMANTAQNIPRVSAKEYLEMERDASCKHEFVDGIVYMMAGASREHNTIALDIRGVLRGSLARPCRPYASDVKVLVQTEDTERYYYPDVVVTCSDLDNDRYILRQPVLIIEVLSDRTEAFDRGEKFEAYKLLPSFQEYLLVQQVRPKVELFRKSTNWQCETFGLNDEVSLESVKIMLPIKAFYQDIDFPA